MKPSQFKVVEQAESSLLLPTKSVIVKWRPQRLKYLLIGPPKWGKTTFFSGCPNVCLLAFEAGYSDVDCPKIVITSWDRPYKQKKLGWDVDDDGIVYTSAMEVIDEMEDKCPYDLAIIDTLDMATKMASDYHCDKANVDHPSEGGDWGRGWELLQTTPVRKFYNRLLTLGIGVVAISHSDEKDKKDKFGNVSPIRETSLPKRVQHFAHTQSDVIMHGMFARLRRGQKDRDRYISFDGSGSLMAGTRIRKVYIPNRYIVDPPTRTDDSPPWRQWESFFTNSPEAGKLAEQNFAKLMLGADDETIERPSRLAKAEKNKTYVEKEVSTNKRKVG